MKKLTQDTLVPLGLAIGMIGGGSMWLTRLSTAVEIHERRLNEGKLRYELQTDRANEVLLSIEKRLSVIEGELKRIRR